MREKRWILTGVAAALFLGLLAARPAAASGCGVTWTSDRLTTGDINGDDLIDGLDLGALLGEWGPCRGCASDFNQDEEVGCVDREFLLGNWGECVPPSPDDLDGLPGVGCGDLTVLLRSLYPCTGELNWESIEPYGGAPIYDVDNNGKVTGHDVEIVRCLLGESSTVQPFADFDLDGTVDEEDLARVEGALDVICPDLNQDGKLGWPDVYVLIKRWP